MAVAAVSTDFAASPATRSEGVGSIAEVQDRFLTLLVAQLQNQDPMNPMENAELTSQLAQMSTVEGINNLNASLDALVASYHASQSVQAAALINHSVMVASDVLALKADGAPGGMDLSAPADKVELQILDATGAVLGTIPLGPQDAGFSTFRWDGTDSSGAALPPGTYRFAVQATAAGTPVEATTYAAGLVSAVTMAGNDVTLDVEGMGAYSFSQVRQIF